MIIHWTNGSFVADMYKSPGSKLVGLKQQGYRPDSVTVARGDLQYFLENPTYLKHLIGAMR